MQLSTLEITPEEATERLAEYENQLASERTAEDAAILAAYRHASRGLPIIRLSKAFEIAGCFPSRRGSKEGEGLPRLGLVRADFPTCHIDSDAPDWVFGGEVDSWGRLANRGALINRAGTVRVRGANTRGCWERAWTPAPIIPPRHRPNRRRLHLFHVLFEVESWTPEPSRDPALIRHIRGDLWSVVAVWDLTDIERAVLAQR